MTTAARCPVTVYTRQPRNREHICGEPVVADGLCAEHLADRERLK